MLSNHAWLRENSPCTWARWSYKRKSLTFKLGYRDALAEDDRCLAAFIPEPAATLALHGDQVRLDSWKRPTVESLVGAQASPRCPTAVWLLVVCDGHMRFADSAVLRSPGPYSEHCYAWLGCPPRGRLRRGGGPWRGSRRSGCVEAHGCRMAPPAAGSGTSVGEGGGESFRWGLRTRVALTVKGRAENQKKSTVSVLVVQQPRARGVCLGEVRP